MTPQEEQRLKNLFVQNNPHANRGIKAATGHIRTYADHVTSQQKIIIRQSWVDKIDELALKYVTPQSFETFIADISALETHMNESFPGMFAEGSFSFARAQKSFSVVLKYRWCEGIISTPPMCPIDRGVLRHLGHPFNIWRWPEMTEEQYLQAYRRIGVLANEKNMSVAQLELLWFS